MDYDIRDRLWYSRPHPIYKDELLYIEPFQLYTMGIAMARAPGEIPLKGAAPSPEGNEPKGLKSCFFSGFTGPPGRVSRRPARRRRNDDSYGRDDCNRRDDERP
jgi:hypothetical protein